MNFKSFLTIAVCLIITLHLHAQTWTPYNVGSVDPVINISFPTSDTGYVVTETPELRKTTDGGLNWTVVPTPFYIWNTYFTTGLKGFGFGGDTALYMTQNGGVSWVPVISDNEFIFMNMHFANSMNGYITAFNLFATNDSTRLYKTINGGTTWNLVNTVENYFDEHAIFFNNATEGFLGYGPAINSTTNGGSSFSNVWTDPTFSSFISQMFFPNADTGYAINYGGLTLRTVNGGSTWNTITNPAPAGFYDLYFIDGKKGFVCGGTGTGSGWVQKTSTAGASWTPSYLSTNTFGCMDFPNDSVGYAGGTNGTVIKYSSTITGIESQHNENSISIYPNPTTNDRIIIDAGKRASGKVEIFNSVGQIVRQQIMLSDETTQFVVEGLETGIYYVRVLFDDGEWGVKELVVL